MDRGHARAARWPARRSQRPLSLPAPNTRSAQQTDLPTPPRHRPSTPPGATAGLAPLVSLCCAQRPSHSALPGYDPGDCVAHVTQVMRAAAGATWSPQHMLATHHAEELARRRAKPLAQIGAPGGGKVDAGAGGETALHRGQHARLAPERIAAVAQDAEHGPGGEGKAGEADGDT